MLQHFTVVLFVFQFFVIVESGNFGLGLNAGGAPKCTEHVRRTKSASESVKRKA